MLSNSFMYGAVLQHGGSLEIQNFTKDNEKSELVKSKIIENFRKQ